jgi:serine/threonine protein kinase
MAFPGNTTAIVHDGILNRTPVPASQANQGLPPKLDEIIGKALEKDRKLRYQSVAEIRTDLHRMKRDTESGPLSPATSAIVGVGEQRGISWKAIAARANRGGEAVVRERTADQRKTPRSRAVVSGGFVPGQTMG